MITILKGDTSADISFALAEGFDYSGATVHVGYQGAVKTFTGCAAGDVLGIIFSAEETAVMSLGSYPVTVRITGRSGMVKTIQNATTKICVTDDPSEVSGGVIALDVKGMLYGIEDLPERWTEADLVAKLREIMRRGGAVLCALLAFSAFGASVQTARKDAIYNDAQIVTNVTFDGLATTNDTGAISRSVNALWQYTFGDRTWIAVTNYMRTAEGVVPSLQLWEVRDGATNCVYSSGEEIAHVVSNEVGRIALVFSNLLEGVRAQIPTTAWSAYQSMSGAPNPASNEVTVVSTPSVMLTGGAEWQQYVDVSSNSLWVLSSSGVTIAGSDTNGYFRIYDAEGKAAFEVVKEKAETVPAIPQGNMRPPGDTGTMSVTFIAKTQPILWLAPTLSPPAFVEASEDSNASVSWTDNGNGTWTAEVDFVNVYDKYFAYATFVKPGTTIVKNNAPMRVDGGIVTSDGKRIKPVVSGSAVSWEVVAE